MADDKPGGTLAWAGSILFLSVFVLAFTALFATPALMLLNGDPFATGIAILIVIYLAMRTVRNVSTDEVEESVATIEGLDTGRQAFVFFIAMLTLSVGVTSVHVWVLATVATWLASVLPQTPMVGLALPTGAILASAVDGWLGRQYGVSLGSLGLYIGMVVMYGVAFTIQADRSSIELAGDELFAAFFGGSRSRPR